MLLEVGKKYICVDYITENKKQYIQIQRMECGINGNFFYLGIESNTNKEQWFDSYGVCVQSFNPLRLIGEYAPVFSTTDKYVASLCISNNWNLCSTIHSYTAGNHECTYLFDNPLYASDLSACCCGAVKAGLDWHYEWCPLYDSKQWGYSKE